MARKRRKKKGSNGESTSDKIHTIRGGFASAIPPFDLSRITKESIGAAYDAVTKPSFSTANKLSDYLLPPAAVKVKNTILGLVPSFDEGGILTSSKGSAFREINSERKRVGGSVNYETLIHKTNFEIGQPSTRSVNMLARLNGTEKRELFNTQVGGTFGANSVGRAELSFETGFNQKQTFCVKDLTPEIAEINALYEMGDYIYAENKRQRIYGLMRMLYSHLRVMNNGQYFRSKVKIHVLKPTRASSSFVVPVTTAFPNDTQFTNQSADGTIPHSDSFAAFIETPRVISALSSIRSSMYDSPNFRRNFEHVKTFTKTLAPGDVWDWKMETHLGPGARLDETRRIQDLNPDALLGYLVVIEHQGVPCEAVNDADRNESFIGTSPSFLQIEFNKGVEGVLASTTQADYNAVAAAGGVASGKFAIKVFTDNDASGPSSKLINFNVGNVTEPGTGAGNIFIPVMTDTVVDYAGEAKDQATP